MLERFQRVILMSGVSPLPGFVVYHLVICDPLTDPLTQVEGLALFDRGCLSAWPPPPLVACPWPAELLQGQGKAGPSALTQQMSSFC